MNGLFDAMTEWGRWVLINALGAFVAEAIFYPVAGFTFWFGWDRNVWWIVHITTYGLIAGVVQYQGFPDDFQGRGWWLIAGILGGLMSWLPIWISPWRDSPWIEELSLPLATYGLLGGAAIGLCHWPKLRQHPWLAGWWVVTSAIGWGLAVPGTSRMTWFGARTLAWTLSSSVMGLPLLWRTRTPAPAPRWLAQPAWHALERRHPLLLALAGVALILGALHAGPALYRMGYEWWHYQRAQGAIQAQQWDTAAEAIITLEAVDSTYYDLPTLIASYPELVDAVRVRRATAWQTGTVTWARKLIFQQANMEVVAFSSDGQLFASGGHDRTIKLWRLQDGALVQTFAGHASSVMSIAFSPDGQLLASGVYDHTVKLWRVQDGAPLQTFTGHTSTVTSVAFSPDGQLLASGSSDCAVTVWHVASGTRRWTHSVPCPWNAAAVSSVVFSPDGQTLAASRGDGTIDLLSTRTGEQVRVIASAGGPVHSIAFSPDGQILASGGTGGILNLWWVRDGTLRQTLPGHVSSVESVAFSPDGQILASSWHTTLKLWRVRDGRLLHTLLTFPIWSMAFSPDGTTLASGSLDGTIRLWRAVPAPAVP